MHDCTIAGRQQAASTLRFQRIIRDVLAERRRQDAKFGEQNHPPQDWLAILAEEVGEFSRAHMDLYYTQPLEPGVSIEERNAFQASIDAKRRHLREELVQVAAVAIAMLECADRNQWSPL